jgi:ATP-dependent DNA ligase
MFAAMLRSLPAGFIAPCLPTKADTLPSGEMWLHEIKHDGFRIIARKDGERVRLYSRPGNDMTRRFPLIAEALTGLRSRSCSSMGKPSPAMTTGSHHSSVSATAQHDGEVFLYAFDLIELNGDDLRRDPLQGRKATLASILAKTRPGRAPLRPCRNFLPYGLFSWQPLAKKLRRGPGVSEPLPDRSGDDASLAHGDRCHSHNCKDLV